MTAAESWGTPEPYLGKIEKIKDPVFLEGVKLGFFADSETIASSNGGICDNIKLLIRK